MRVIPRAAREGLAGVEDHALKVRLNAPPVDGAANKALVKLMAKTLGLAKGKISLSAGLKSRNKRLLVQGLTPKQLKDKLGIGE